MFQRYQKALFFPEPVFFFAEILRISFLLGPMFFKAPEEKECVVWMLSQAAYGVPTRVSPAVVVSSFCYPSPPPTPFLSSLYPTPLPSSCSPWGTSTCSQEEQLITMTYVSPILALTCTKSKEFQGTLFDKRAHSITITDYQVLKQKSSIGEKARDLREKNR